MPATPEDESQQHLAHPSTRGLLHASPLIALTFLVFLAYDLGVLDVQATKHAAFVGGVALWTVYAVLSRFAMPRQRLAFGLPLLVLFLTVVPTFARGAPADVLFHKPLHLTALAMAYVLCRQIFAVKATATAVLWSLTGLALIFSLSATVETFLLGGEPEFSGAPVATLGNPNHLGACLVLLMPAILACSTGPRGLRWPILGIGALSTFAIALSGSYLAMLGAAAALGLAAAHPHLDRRSRGVFIAVLLGGLVLGLSLRDHRRASSAPVVETSAPQAQSSGFERALEGRTYLAGRGLEVFSSAPLLGVGTGEYAWGFANAQAAYLEAHPDQAYLHTRLVHAHNDPLELLAENGLLGFLALILGWMVLTRAARRLPVLRYRQPPRFPVYALSGVALFVMLSLGHFVLFLPQAALLGVIYAALLGGRRLSLPHKLVQGVRVGLILLSVVAMAITIRVYGSERLLVQGLEASEDGRQEEAHALLERAQSLHPSGQVLSHRGTLFLLEGRLDEAIVLLEGAAFLLPLSEVHQNLGLALCWKGEERDRALRRLQVAIQLDPTREEARRALEACQSLDGP